MAIKSCHIINKVVFDKEAIENDVNKDQTNLYLDVQIHSF